jgi:hypothetical protein
VLQFTGKVSSFAEGGESWGHHDSGSCHSRKGPARAHLARSPILRQQLLRIAVQYEREAKLVQHSRDAIKESWQILNKADGARAARQASWTRATAAARTAPYLVSGRSSI